MLFRIGIGTMMDCVANHAAYTKRMTIGSPPVDGDAAHALFGFQLQFAARLAEHFQLPFAQVLFEYTTLSKTFGQLD
jgi:hypothetical protein